LFEFFFKYFLLFPKIQLGGGQDDSSFGILIGEIVLSLYCLFLVLFNSRILVKLPPVILYVFILYFILISSVLQTPLTGMVPVMSALYFFRICIYIGIYVFCYHYNTAASNEQIIQKFFISPYRLQFFLGTLIVVAYYLTHAPTLNEIMWNYNTGLRLIPFGGMAIDKDSFFFLRPIGGGSGNLLCSWSLAILILVDNFDLKKNRPIIIIVVATVLLTLSRGGAFTIFIYIVYMLLRKNILSVSLLLRLAVFAAIVFLVLDYSGGKLSIISNIFSRIQGTFEGGNLDPSSMGRIKNYIDVTTPWVKSPFFILFGMGYDEGILEHYTGQSIVESFLLQVIVSSGIIGTILFILFYYAAYQLSKVNLWFDSLWKFLIFESLIQWSITGGDFFSPHVLFVIMAMFGFGYREVKLYQKPQLT
jgi:hypothetical protein